MAALTMTADATAANDGSTIAIAENVHRIALVLKCPATSAEAIRVNFGAAASATLGIPLGIDSGIVLEGDACPTGAVYVYGAAGTGKLSAGEASKPANVGRT